MKLRSLLVLCSLLVSGSIVFAETPQTIQIPDLAPSSTGKVPRYSVSAGGQVLGVIAASPLLSNGRLAGWAWRVEGSGSLGQEKLKISDASPQTLEVFSSGKVDFQAK